MKTLSVSRIWRRNFRLVVIFVICSPIFDQHFTNCTYTNKVWKILVPSRYYISCSCHIPNSQDSCLLLQVSRPVGVLHVPSRITPKTGFVMTLFIWRLKRYQGKSSSNAPIIWNPAPIIWNPGPYGAADSGATAGLKCRDLTSDESRQCRRCARVLISR